MRSIGIKLSKLEKISQELFKKVDELKYSYDLTDEEVASIIEIKDNIIDNHNSYDHIIDIFRNKTLAYSKLASEMENINNKLLKNEDRLNHTLETLSSLKDDELRAKEQLAEIEEILKDCKLRAREYKLPVVPKNYYVEFAEASLAINDCGT